MTFAYGSLERPVVAPSVQESNLICARVNLQRLKLIAQVKPLKSDGLPPEDSVYNKGRQMLKADLSSLAIQLRPRVKRKLIISGMAAHLGFLARQDQPRMDRIQWLKLLGRLGTLALHAKAYFPNQLPFSARGNEATSLWSLDIKI
jgi:hypothetical protein